MMMRADSVLAGLQEALDAEREGWHVTHYAAVVGLERLDSDTSIDRNFAVYYSDGQHDYITLGLLARAFLTIAER